jgi:hypothetical protein
MFDASINYSEYKKKPSTKLGYDVDNIGFKNLAQAIALGSKSTFRYTPSKEDIIKYYAKKNGISDKSVIYDNIADNEIREATLALQAAEELQPI